MIGMVFGLLRWLIWRPRSEDFLRLENLALRHQIAVLLRHKPSRRFRPWDRWFWTTLREICPRWRSALLIVSPETVLRWHRNGFRLFWRWRSRRRPGGPPIHADPARPIWRMWEANPSWGSPRIQAELAKLGLHASTSTIRRYRPRPSHQPSQSWRT